MSDLKTHDDNPATPETDPAKTAYTPDELAGMLERDETVDVNRLARTVADLLSSRNAKAARPTPVNEKEKAKADDEEDEKGGKSSKKSPSTP